jgi:hypothetical protein
VTEGVVDEVSKFDTERPFADSFADLPATPGPTPMSTTADLVRELKAQLKLAGITYARLAAELGLAESSVKRIFASGDMPLSRVDEVLRVLKMDFADLARKVADAQPPRRELTHEQEAAVVADPKLLLVAICCLSRWSLDQIVATYELTEAEAVQRLAVLDRLGVIELRPMNRYRLLVAKTFRFRAGGPLMAYFRQHVVADYFASDFDGPDELLLTVHGQVTPQAVGALRERLVRAAEDFAQQHLADQRLPADRRRAITLVVGLRGWLFSGLRGMLRTPEQGRDAA